MRIDSLEAMISPLPGQASELSDILARAHYALGSDPSLAWNLAEQARLSVEPLGEPGILAECYFVLGSSSIAQGEYQQADGELQHALELASPAEGNLAIRILRALLKCAFFTQDHERALGYGHDALRLSLERADRASEGLTRNDLGLIYGSLGDFGAALEHLLGGLRIAREEGSGRIGSLLNNIGNIYLEIGDLTEAANFYREALDAFHREGDRMSEAIALGNIGRVHSGLGRFQEALLAYEQSERIHGETPGSVYLAPALSRSASALAALGHKKDARHRFERAMREIRQAPNSPFRDEILAATGRFHLDEGEFDLAISLLEEAHALLLESGMTHHAHELYDSLSSAYEQLGRPDRALAHFKEYHRVRQAMADSALNVGIRALMIEFDVERARQQEEIFRLRNVELARANEELKELHARLQAKNRELRRMSVEDPLTGLYNRRYLDRQLEKEIARARRQNLPLCVAICDLDFFKETNDRFSHLVGDQVLRKVATLLRQTLRTSDVLARFGGDEFVVILPDTDLHGAEALAERLRAAVQDHPWQRLRAGLHLTLSIGIRELSAELDGSELLTAADARLYEAKRAGRDRVVV